MKQLLVKHCGVAHGYFAKPNIPPGQNQRPPPIRNRTAFYLWTTPMTKAARNVCTNTIKLRKLTRKPFKLVELAELNKEWSKQPRNIQQIMDEYTKKKRHHEPNSKTSKLLDIKLIEIIFKNRMKILKHLKKQSDRSLKKMNGANNISTNGHQNEDEDREGYDDEEDDDASELVIDNEESVKNANEQLPEFLKYFEKKCSSPCYVPERLAFLKPTSDQINKYHLNIMSQTRKRPHDQLGQNDTSNKSNANLQSNENGSGGSNESSPLSKRSLIANNHNNIKSVQIQVK
jgi:hypothetical protein